MLSGEEMSQFKGFLATIRFPPNPYRGLDNTLPLNLTLKGQRTSGRFAMRGLPLPVGNAHRGLELYTRNFLDSAFQCASCHTLPTGMAPNGPILASILNFPVGVGSLPTGPMGENHLGVVSTDGFTNVSMKVPQTRNMHEKVGTEFSSTESLSGFGFAHDGSVASLADFFSAALFSPQSDQDIADLVALNMAFSGSEFQLSNPTLSAAAPISMDAHAGVGLQTHVFSGTLSEQSGLQLQMAQLGKLDLIVQAADRQYLFDAISARFSNDFDSTRLSLSELLALSVQSPQVWTSLSRGLGARLALDRDGDGVPNALEIAQGSNPADGSSKTVRALSGMWFNPERIGSSFDIQYSGNIMLVNWYTYENDGLPVWYQAVAPYSNNNSQQLLNAKLNRFVWNPITRRVIVSEVGELSLQFNSKSAGLVNWRLGTNQGTQLLQPLIDGANSTFNRTGNWYDSNDPGWGLSVYTRADVNVTVMHFYDANQQPRWIAGQGNNDDQLSIEMHATRGACPSCAYAAPTRSAAGSIKLQFNGTRALKFQTDVFSNATPNVRWQRETNNATVLTSPAWVVEWN
jgi:hypothetical protein